MVRFLLLAALTFAATPVAAQRPPTNPFNDQLRRLTPDRQKAAMRQAVTNNGLRCGRVDLARYQQPFNNLQMWHVRCTPGGDYAVYVGRDRSVQARRCEEAAELKLPRCR